MLIWGSKGKMVAAGDGGTQYCDVCKEQRSFTHFASYKMRHIWFVIRWATGLQYHRRCATCHNLYDMPAPVQTDGLSGEAVKSKSPVPFFDRWGWAIAAGAIVLFIASAVVTGNREKAEEKLLIAAPKAGDIYQVAVDRFIPEAESQSLGSDYGVVRVERVDGDRVTLSLPRTVYNRAKGARQDISSGQARSDTYYEGTIEMPLATLKARHDDGAISNVVR
ncbi:hypothetical protein ACFOWX_11555 [Sphingorhabdus arenilitoris]|uniref:Zinc-ribbon domain-containing protein n=1 Tax=Sphingorhabdus arenilitoris TaxID=1490041 RepID=A0ABV8RKN1_9SPHN